MFLVAFAALAAAAVALCVLCCAVSNSTLSSPAFVCAVTRKLLVGSTILRIRIAHTYGVHSPRHLLIATRASCEKRAQFVPLALGRLPVSCSQRHERIAKLIKSKKHVKPKSKFSEDEAKIASARFK